MYRAVLQTMRRVGATRMNALCNSAAVRLHNAGRLATFKELGITSVGVIPERLPRARGRAHDHAHTHARVRDQDEEFVNVITAGDDDVCEECEGISEEGPYSLDEAESLIPAHPNCRCAFVPAMDMRFKINQLMQEAYELGKEFLEE